MITLEQAEAIVGEPATDWAGRCYEIATKLAVATDEGAAVYGHWIGEPGSYFGGRAALEFIPHGWIERPDGSVIDPTRWVFENAEPYIYEGVNDHYDRGGNVFRARNLRPPPDFDPDSAFTFVFDIEDDALSCMEGLLMHPGQTVCYEQAFWLANLPVAMLDEFAVEIFTALVDADLAALIPIDNKRMVLGDD